MYHQQILQNIEPIDVRKKVGFNNENRDERLKDSHYLITVVEELQQKAQKLGYDFATENGFYYLFNGNYWQNIREEEVKRLLTQVSNRIGIEKYKYAYYLFQDNLLKQFLAHTPVLCKRNEEEIKINLANGTFVFGDPCVLKPFDKDDYLKYQLPFEFNLQAAAPLFRKYLDRVLPDKKCQDILAEYVGYVFTKGNKQQKCLLLYGSGANGKSVFFEIIRALMGNLNVTSYSLKNLGDENCRAAISNKLLNYSSEIDANINNETFKQLVSGEPIQARLKYKDSFIMENYAKLMFNCNELPKDVEFTHAYFRRFLIVPFSQNNTEAEQDIELAGKIIKTELSGIFNWVLEGLVRLQRHEKFTESVLVAKALDDFRRESDTVCEFAQYYGYFPSDNKYERLQETYKTYQQFCTSGGYRQLSIKNFRKRLESQNYRVTRHAAGWVVYIDRDGLDDDDIGLPF